MSASSKLPTSFERLREVGRPEFWTEDRIKQLGERLETWSKNPESISMTEFRTDEELTMKVIEYLRGKSEEFCGMYDLAKQRIANRISKNAGKGVHPIHYTRYISLYDPELHRHDQEMASIKSAAAAQVRAEEVQKGVSIIDRFESVAKKDS